MPTDASHQTADAKQKRAAPGHARAARQDLLVVGLVAAGVRAAYFASASDHDWFRLPIVDAAIYDQLARAIASGDAVNTDSWFFHGLGYPLLLSLVYRIEPSVMLAKAVQLAIGVCTCLCTYAVGSQLAGRRAGVIASLMVALYAPLFFLQGELLDAGWTAFAGIGLVWLILRVDGSRSTWLYAAWGSAAAVAILVRSTFLPFGALALIWLWWRANRNWRLGSVGAAVLSTVLAFAALSSLGQTGRFTFMPGAAGLNAFIGNNPALCQTLTIRPGHDWNTLVRSPGASNSGLWERHDYFLERARQFASEHPLQFLSGLGHKLLALIASREIPRNVDVYLYRSDVPLLAVGVWKAGRFGFPFGLLLPLAALGAAVNWRRIPTPVWLMLGSHATRLVLEAIS
jgi:4-amino-4-deoxy-L-arabinose transferase-like glycosyltransferase